MMMMMMMTMMTMMTTMTTTTTTTTTTIIHFLFTHNRLIRYLFSVVNPDAVAALLLTSFLHRSQQGIFNEKTNYFQPLAASSEIFI